MGKYFAKLYCLHVFTDLVNSLNKDNKVIYESLEDYKTALAFLVQKHKQLQKENSHLTEIKQENEFLATKLHFLKELGLAGFTDADFDMSKTKQKNEYFVGLLKLFKTEFEAKITEKDSQIISLAKENEQLRELLHINKEYGTLTKQGKFDPHLSI